MTQSILDRLESKLDNLLRSQYRNELYNSGMFSIELAKLGLIPPELLMEIIDTITQRIEEDNNQRKEEQWPRPRNLAA